VYAIRGAPNATLKRRRFREFVKLREDLLADWPDAPELPSKLFHTSAETRLPALQAFLRAALSKKKTSRVLLDFVGLDDDDDVVVALAAGESPLTAFDPAALDNANTRIATLLDILYLASVLLAVLICLALGASVVAALVAATVDFALCFALRPRLFKAALVPVPLTATKPAAGQTPSAVSLVPEGPEDLNVTPAERVKLRQLRERLEDFLRPQDEPQWLKTHAEALAQWKPDLTRVQNAALRERMWKESIMVDRRLVWFIRGSSTLDEAEYQARDAMLSRMVFDFDDLPLGPRPPQWICDYAASEVLMRHMVDPLGQSEARIQAWWLRDRDGNLLTYSRPGPAKSQAIYDKFGENEKTMIQVLCWFIEALRRDFDRVHDETRGRVTAQVTLVSDLTDFSLSTQLGASCVLPLARKYVPILAPIYRGVLKRVIVINAPWYINMLMKLITPFVPKEILDCIAIHGSLDADKHLRPFIDDANIPKYLGGQWAGDPVAHFPPAGPWALPDKGESLLH